MRRGLLLDFDGTLVDSLPLLKKTYSNFLKSNGVPEEKAPFQKYNGVTLPETMKRLIEEFGISGEPLELTRAYLESIREAYQAISPMLGAEKVVRRCAVSGWGIAIVTSNAERICFDWLRSQNLSNEIKVVIGYETVKKGKPDPEPFRRAIEVLAVDKESTYAVEDSANGARSAIAAGAKTIFLAHDESVGAPSGVHAVVRSWNQLQAILES